MEFQGLDGIGIQASSWLLPDFCARNLSVTCAARSDVSRCTRVQAGTATAPEHHPRKGQRPFQHKPGIQKGTVTQVDFPENAYVVTRLFT